MKRFEPSEYGLPGDVIEAIPVFDGKTPEIPSSDRLPDQWQPLGSVVRRVVARLGERERAANG